MQPLHPPPGRPIMASPVQPKKDRTAGAVIGCLVGFALLVALGAAGVLFWVRGRVTPPPPPAAGEPVPPSDPQRAAPPQPVQPVQPVRAAPVATPTIGFMGDLEWERPVEAADMTRVDLVDLYAQARPIAERLQPGAQFVGIVAFDIQGGVANLTADSRVLLHFEFAGTDPNQPPGKDSVEYKVDVEAKAGTLKGRRMKWPAIHLKRGMGGVLAPPTCPSVKAWAAAVQSGVAANAVATIHYYDNKVFSPRSPVVWSVRVDGHDEFRREIDGQTCAMVKSWAK